MRPALSASMRCALASTLLATTIAWGARADEPPEPAASRKISSGASDCWAYTDARNKVTIGYRRAPSAKSEAAGAEAGASRPVELWKVPGWYRVAALSRDCEYLVTGYDGVNLLPSPPDLATILLAFYKGGTLIRQIRLDELIHDLSKLRKTESHYEWGSYVGVEKNHYYRVQTNDRGSLIFDMTTGQITTP